MIPPALAFWIVLVALSVSYWAGAAFEAYKWRAKARQIGGFFERKDSACRRYWVVLDGDAHAALHVQQMHEMYAKKYEPGWLQQTPKKED